MTCVREIFAEPVPSKSDLQATTLWCLTNIVCNSIEDCLSILYSSFFMFISGKLNSEVIVVKNEANWLVSSVLHILN
jgi:hypothetical protein